MSIYLNNKRVAITKMDILLGKDKNSNNSNEIKKEKVNVKSVKKKKLIKLTDKFDSGITLESYLKFNSFEKEAYSSLNSKSKLNRYKECFLKNDNYSKYLKEKGYIKGLLYGNIEIYESDMSAIINDQYYNIMQDMVDDNGHLKIKFRETYGDFTCVRTLKSFEGCPIIINGNFDCSNVFVDDIKNNYNGFPLIITGDLLYNEESNVYQLFGLHNDINICYVGGKIRNLTLETLNRFGMK